TGQRGTSLRLANVTGPRSTHGVVVDLVAKLRRDPKRLELLGDGTQRKSYVHIDDVVEAFLAAWQRQHRPCDAFNVGSADTLDVKEIADIVCRVMGLRDVQYQFKPSAGGRGWPGDVKVMQLDIAKLQHLGWKPRHGSAATIEAAARDAAGQR
ncbi:MAG: NAD-dependent epimerase/dehydratase family protein, partial [Halobacteriales archaeon]|nr:NAD-dependent epimerase/dehydratase family protein [Halobacteriales archaeon]